MEEEDLIYALDGQQESPDAPAESDTNAEPVATNDENNETDNNNKNNNKNDENDDKAQQELQKMIEEVGAENLLEIIRDNRNAVIRQILKEVAEAQPAPMPSGISVRPSCASIFDLAALA